MNALSLPGVKRRMIQQWPHFHLSPHRRHEQGHEVVLWLQAEAVVLAKKGVVDGVQGAGLPALKVLANTNTILSQGIPVWVCSTCATARQINEPDLEVGAMMKGMQDYVKAITESDRNLSY
ncbi:MAG TPA: DsrE family protein [Nitrospirales bacterium]|nr:DsrE family protein [Nitrospirales bacterium]